MNIIAQITKPISHAKWFKLLSITTYVIHIYQCMAIGFNGFDFQLNLNYGNLYFRQVNELAICS